jgi:uncharacterized membrane protein YfcA
MQSTAGCSSSSSPGCWPPSCSTRSCSRAPAPANTPPRLPSPLFFTFTGLGLGFYDGFFGPGAGSFGIVALIAVMGYDFMRATGATKIVNAASARAALGVFMVAGHVRYAAGLTMGGGQVIGARIGSGLVVKKDARFVRPVFLTMVVLVMLRLLWVSHAGG